MKYNVNNPLFRSKLIEIDINPFDIFNGENFDYVKFNNIKFEIKSNKYTVGYDSDEALLTLLEKTISNLNFQVIRKKDRINIKFKKDDGDIIDNFVLILKEIEKESIFDHLKNFQDTTPNLFRINYRPTVIAKKYFEAIKYKDQKTLNNHRSILCADDYDQFITVNNQSKERTYREHLVPCIFLHQKIINKIINEDTNLKEIAKIIKKNLKIAYISNNDAFKLDYEFNLKTRMPNEWNLGDDIFARLNQADIKII